MKSIKVTIPELKKTVKELNQNTDQFLDQLNIIMDTFLDQSDSNVDFSEFFIIVIESNKKIIKMLKKMEKLLIDAHSNKLGTNFSENGIQND